MTFLPIVERELRVASRKRSTFWLRVGAATVAMVIGSGCLLLTAATPLGTAGLGRVLFGALAWIGAAVALSAGLFFTSDCLSEEKREGTLGLLFLTDLRGHDVAAGKLLATSLRGFYAFLAIVPILAVTLLMGGVTGAQMWKTSLALLNALFCSLAAGLVVSALSRDSQKALGGALLLLLLLTFGGPLTDATISGLKKSGFDPILSLTSPGYAMSTAGDWGRSPFWRALLVNQTIAWLLFALTCALVPRTWQEKTSRVAEKSWSYSWRYGSKRRRTNLRRKLIDRNAVLWLACRERWQAAGIWTMVLLAGSGFGLLVWKLPREAWMLWNYLGGFIMLFLYLWAASQACRIFIEARRSGLSELLLTSPLDGKQIVSGQWQALWRMFGMQVILFLCLHTAAAALSQESWRRVAAQAGAAASSISTSTNSSSQTVIIQNRPARSSARNPSGKVVPRAPVIVTLVAALAAATSATANIVALCWFGMWMGMTSRTAIMAALKTFAFVHIIPWVVISFTSAIVTFTVLMPRMMSGGAVAGTQFIAWYPLLTTVLTAALTIAKDIGFFVWSREKLYSSFREQAARTFGRPASAPPPVPPPIARPPVIGLSA
jgi:ABC-type transport system involved in multi-copper enzyme maturation permease subunit